MDHRVDRLHQVIMVTINLQCLAITSCMLSHLLLAVYLVYLLGAIGCKMDR